jgi:5-methyltetrahydropteroyltriglutamate--homocysteine methyltransferase
VIQATGVGNYPRIGDRPEQQKLRRALAKKDRDEINDEGLRRVEDEVTREVIDEQYRSGIDLVTDGQIRWADAQTYIAGRLAGIRLTGLIRWFDTNTYFRQPQVESAVRWEKPIIVDDYRFAVNHSDRPVKPVLTGPFTLAKLSHDRHYQNEERLTLDYARALSEEVAALEEAGADPIQIDEPAILWWPQQFGLLEKGIAAVAKGRKKARLALYIYFRAAGDLIDRLDGLPVDILGLDLVEGRDDLPRLEASPPPKTLALGILNGRNTRLESEDDAVTVVARIWKAAGKREMYVNPSTGLEFLPRDTAFRKLELLSRITARVNRMET